MLEEKELKILMNHLIENGYTGNSSNIDSVLKTIEHRRKQILINAAPFLSKLHLIMTDQSLNLTQFNKDYLENINFEVEEAAVNNLAMMDGFKGLNPEPLIKIIRTPTTFELIGISDRRYHNPTDGKLSVYKIFGGFEASKEIYYGGESFNLN